MKSLLLKIKNLFPYFLLIGIYFFFVNIEARNSQNKNITTQTEEEINKSHSDKTHTSKIIAIPVFPYN